MFCANSYYNWLLANFTALLYFVSIPLRIFVGLALPRHRMFTQNLIGDITLSRVIIPVGCSCSKMRHKAHRKVLKCSLTFPLKNGIVTCYVQCTKKYDRVDKL